MIQDVAGAWEMAVPYLLAIQVGFPNETLREEVAHFVGLGGTAVGAAGALISGDSLFLDTDSAEFKQTLEIFTQFHESWKKIGRILGG